MIGAIIGLMAPWLVKMPNILILDDNFQYITWIEDFIRSIIPDAKIKFVDRYDRAVYSLNQIKPDLIITDICIGIVNYFPELPSEWGGLKFIHYVREIKKWGKDEVKIITFTGESDIKLVNLIEKYDAVYGCKSWLDFFRDDLKEILRNLLHNAS